MQITVDTAMCFNSGCSKPKRNRSAYCSDSCRAKASHQRNIPHGTCLYPDYCIMPGIHLQSECCTADMVQQAAVDAQD